MIKAVNENKTVVLDYKVSTKAQYQHHGAVITKMLLM